MPVHWNFRDILNLYPEDESFLCVGSDESRGFLRRCNNEVDIRDRIAASTVLDDIDGSTSHDFIFKGLEELSYLTVCKEHQNNMAKPQSCNTRDEYSEFKEVFRDRWTEMRREHSRKAVERYKARRMRRGLNGLHAIADEEESVNSPKRPTTLLEYPEEEGSQYGQSSPREASVGDNNSIDREERYRRRDTFGHQGGINPMYGSLRYSPLQSPTQMEEQNPEEKPSLRVLVQSVLVPSPPETPIPSSIHSSIYDGDHWNFSGADTNDKFIDSYLGERREPERARTIPNREVRFSFEPGRDERLFNTRQPTTWPQPEPPSVQKQPAPAPALLNSRNAISPPIPAKSPRRMNSTNTPRNYTTPNCAPPMPRMPPSPASSMSPSSTQHIHEHSPTKGLTKHTPSQPSPILGLSAKPDYEHTSTKDISAPVLSAPQPSTQYAYGQIQTTDQSPPVSPVSRLSADNNYGFSVDDVSPLSSRNSSTKSKTPGTKLASPYQHWFQHSSGPASTTTMPSPKSSSPQHLLPNKSTATTITPPLPPFSFPSSAKQPISANAQVHPAFSPHPALAPSSTIALEERRNYGRVSQELPRPQLSLASPTANMSEKRRNYGGSLDLSTRPKLSLATPTPAAPENIRNKGRGSHDFPRPAPVSAPEDNFDYFNASLHLTPYSVSYASLQPNGPAPRTSTSRPRPSLSTIHSVTTIPSPTSRLRKSPKDNTGKQTRRNSIATDSDFSIAPPLDPKSSFSSFSGEGRVEQEKPRWLLARLSVASKVNQSLSAKKKNSEKKEKGKEFVKYNMGVGVFGAARVA